LETVADGSCDPYEGYRQIYAIYAGTSGALAELKPLFRIPGIYPDGPISVNEEFRCVVVAAAVKWLQDHPSS
jgi:hypothetical protein